MCAHLLLAAGAQANREDVRNITPTQIAARNGHLEMVKVLMQDGDGDVMRMNNCGSNAVIEAARGGSLKILTFLVDNRAKPSPGLTGYTPLMAASRGGHVDVIEYLIGFGVEIDEIDKSRLAAIHYAASTGHRSALDTLGEGRLPCNTHSHRQLC